jgi:hypothetical protein
VRSRSDCQRGGLGGCRRRFSVGINEGRGRAMIFELDQLWIVKYEAEDIHV